MSIAKKMPLTNWQPLKPFHPSIFTLNFCSAHIHLVVAKRVRGDPSIFWVLTDMHGLFKYSQIASNSQTSLIVIAKHTMPTERTWTRFASVCTSIASQTLRIYHLHSLSHKSIQKKATGLFSLLVFSLSKYSWPSDHAAITLTFILFTPFVPWKNQMDLLWHKVPKLELVPTQKKHQWCHFMSCLVWFTNNCIQRLAIELIASATPREFTMYR